MNTLTLREPPTCIPTHSEAPSAGIDHRERTSLHDLFGLIGVPVGDEQQSPLPLPAVRRLRAGDLLIIEGAPAASIYIARTGTFKVFRTAEDGYEQVFGFARRGDLLGCDALSSDRHQTAVMALSDASALAIASPDFLALTNSHPAFGRGVMRAVSNAMIDLTRLSDMMAPVSAEVRLARFLMHLSHQLASSGQSATIIRLEMSRRDIGSYIGVAHETISRSFAALADACLVEVAQRKVRIIDLDALQKYAQGTRAPAKSLARVPAAVPRPRFEAIAALAA
ncbi:helix-turn-helix domain-containing protein [Variovorax sp. dw_954]|uniref:Crp/Fnr family transcriptional regulator n=1 Tax=Variovorax sp. dw_954 TaxID=2720078 RepID=UPI001BD47C23|nr:helix-turn-helix domain-containing protein [Variovorax sp. dw_954]